MPVTFKENSESRPVTYGRSGGGETIILNGSGSADQVEIFQAVVLIPNGQPGGPTWDGFIREDIRINVYGISGRSRVEVDYGILGLGGGAIPVGVTPSLIPSVPGGGVTTSPSASLDGSYSFSFGGGTEKVTQSKRVVTSAVVGGGAAPDVKKMIGLTDEGLEGTDKLSSAFEFSRTVVFPQVTMAYLDILSRFCRKLKNADIFYGFAAGTVMLMGVTGQSNEGTKFNVTFQFGVRPNISASNPEYLVGDSAAPDAPNDLVVTSAKGWDYIEVKYQPKEVDGKKMQSPVAFYVHELYPDGDYEELSIGT